MWQDNQVCSLHLASQEKRGDVGAKIITEKLNKVCETETTPENWKTPVTHPCCKKGDKIDNNNYYEISLLCLVFDISSKAPLDILNPQLDKHICRMALFRRGRYCPKEIFNLKKIVWCLKLSINSQERRIIICSF